MYTKIVYVIIDCLAIIDIIFVLRALRKIREAYGRSLRNAMRAAILAIFANILIALSFNAVSAEIAYCIYFAAIDWILFFLCGFCLRYTEHESILKKLTIPAALLMALDSVSIFFNLVFGHQFYIYENIRPSGILFYQTGFYNAYYSHLVIDYAAVLLVLIFIIIRIVKSHSFYRVKYIIILSVLLFVVALNVAYMALALVLDASVVFYAVAGTLIYFCISIFVPRRLMTVAIGRAVDDMNEGLILFDINDNCIYANKFSKKHFEIDETCDMSTEMISMVIKSLNDSGVQFGEVPYVKKKGAGDILSNQYYKVRYNKLSDKRGQKIGSFFLIEDTTEEVFFLNEINEAKNEADNANKAKSSFLASMSHEIRTPLNSVLGMNEMILRSTDDPQLLEYAENIRISGDTLLSLINDILDFSKIEANKMDLVLSEYNPHKLLRDCFHYFEQTAKEKELYIRINCSETIPSLLYGDENHIRQILSNLISNAVKYTKEGGVAIEMFAENTEFGEVNLHITVNDTGIGIEPEDIEYLFDPFRRVNEKMTANIQGTGLGLAITKELIDLMKGNIEVTSMPASGSSFHIILPQQITDSTPAGPFTAVNDTITPKYHESFRSPNARILVVDDVPLNLKLIEALLKQTLVNVDKAEGGESAIEMCMQNKYDVILLDHRMPDPDGIAVFKVISERGLNKDTPVIMLTANALSGAQEEYLDMGFAGYLSKPVHGKDLEEILIKHLDPEKITLTSVPE